jgi:hypothetical protein
MTQEYSNEQKLIAGRAKLNNFTALNPGDEVKNRYEIAK